MGNGLPSLFPHERAVPELEVRDPEPLPGGHIHVVDNKRLLAVALHVDRDRLPAIVDGDLDHDVLDRTCPEGRDVGRLRPVYPFLSSALDRGHFDTKGIITAFGNEVVVHAALVLFRKLDPADLRCSFAGYDCFDHEGLRFAFFGDPLVMAAGGAPDEQVAGLGDDLVLGLVFAFGAVGGDKH